MFYTFRQNNSGGSFIVDELVNEFVIIEADSASEANDTANGIGIYFNGCSVGRDCSCCGDRWDPVYPGQGKEYPSVYDSPPDKIWMCSLGGPYNVVIHYKSGVIGYSVYDWRRGIFNNE